MEAKVIKTEEEYRAALAEAERLMDSTRTEDVAKLELLGVLIEHYENHLFPVPYPDPVAAIRFRMEQAGLSRKDLAKYIGSTSKVSEVLAGKRTLSLAMIRALHEGLGIPAEILLRVPGTAVPKQKHDLARYPFAEMFNRGYFPSFNGPLAAAKGYAEEQLDSLFAVFEEQPTVTK